MRCSDHEHPRVVVPRGNPLEGKTRKLYIACCRDCHAVLYDEEEGGEFGDFFWMELKNNAYLNVLLHLDSFCHSGGRPLDLFADLIDECTQENITPVVGDEKLSDLLPSVLLSVGGRRK